MANKPSSPDPEQLAVDTIRMLSVDAVEKANSGHPGLPMGAADYAFVLWTKHLRYNPADPAWPDRDRFVLSAGHGSMLLYSLLHLAGFDLSLDELKNFRQWDSRTPGHPEYGHTPGVETTTGPLGQGFGNGVGMAIAAKMMAARVNPKPGAGTGTGSGSGKAAGSSAGAGRPAGVAPDSFSPVTHRVFGIVSDGDLMEGVASEAASIAGHLRLGNLIYIYDDNRITIEGETSLAFTEDVGRRFEAYGWHVQHIDGHDRAAADQALKAAVAETGRPSIIVARTHIAQGSPGKHDSAEAHGSPLGPEETAATKKAIGWPAEPAFFVPDEVRALFAARARDNVAGYDAWQRGLAAWRSTHADLAAVWDAHTGRTVPTDLPARLLAAASPESLATRAHSGKVIQKLAELVPALAGGSADLAPSTSTLIKGSASIEAGDFSGRNFHWGIREHGMGAILNGMAVHGTFIPFGATFLVFSDYMRPPIRIAALSRLPVVYVFTHDSVLLGEDGPTHQPIEHVAALRAVPNLVVFRPFDGAETALAWAYGAARRDGPTALILSRQKISLVKRDTDPSPDMIAGGGYTLQEAGGGKPALVIVATGSEVPVAAEARVILEQAGTPTRLVSMPSLDLFFEQPDAARRAIVPDDGTPIVSVEAGVPDGWHRLVGRDGLVIGMERFGASAPAKVLAEKFGFTGPAVAKRIGDWLAQRAR